MSEEEPLTKDDLTKGQAGDMITKVKFGARGRFDKLMKKKKGVEREVEKGKEGQGDEAAGVGQGWACGGVRAPGGADRSQPDLECFNNNHTKLCN